LQASAPQVWDMNIDRDNNSPGAQQNLWPWFWGTQSGSPYPPDIYKVAVTKVKSFTCPSAPTSRASNVVLCPVTYNGPSPGNNLRLTWLYEDYTGGGNNYGFLGLTNYLGVAGLAQGTSPRWSIYEGIFTNRSRTKIVEITDGSSNTLMIGEICGQRVV